MELNKIKPAAGAKKNRRRVGARHRLGPRQDRGPRPQGPEVPRRRLPQGRLRGRPDAAAAPPAQARLPRRDDREGGRGALGRPATVDGDTIDLASLKKAGLVPDRTTRAKIILAGERREEVSRSRASPPRKGAKAAIEKAGGSVADLVGRRARPASCRRSSKSKPQAAA